MRRLTALTCLTLLAILSPHQAAEAGIGREEPKDPGPKKVERYEAGGGAFVGYKTPIRVNAGRGRPPSGSALPSYSCSFFIWADGNGADPNNGLIKGSFYELRCELTGSGELTLGTPAPVQYDPNDPDGGRLTTQPEVDLAARRALEFTEPTLGMSPPVDKLVVGFETWFTASPDATNDSGLPTPDAVTASAGPLWATASAEPNQITIEMGDGQPDSTIVCADLPAPLDPEVDLDSQRPECARYSYQYSSNNEDTPGGTYLIEAVVRYAVYLETSANPAPVFQEELNGDTAEIDATVTELQAVIR